MMDKRVTVRELVEALREYQDQEAELDFITTIDDVVILEARSKDRREVLLEMTRHYIKSIDDWEEVWILYNPKYEPDPDEKWWP